MAKDEATGKDASETNKEGSDTNKPAATASNNKLSWITDNLKSPRSMRLVARCWVASWANFVLMIPGPSLAVLGQAAFFGCMLTLMVPPSMPLPLFIIAFSMIAVGALFGWAWGCAAMAAANRARSQPALQSALQRVQSSIATSTNPDAQYQVAIFQGNFLDVRSTAVFGIFLMVMAYAAAVLQVKKPKLKIASIFMLIVADIMCTYGPLFPFPQYTLGQIFMIPIACSLAICLATQFLIFPETLAYSWQLDYIKLLVSTRQLLESHAAQLSSVGSMFDSNTLTPGHELSEPDNFLKHSLEVEDSISKLAKSHIAQAKAKQAAIAAQEEAIAGSTSFLGMEFTYAYINGADMKTMLKKTHTLSVRLTLINSFWKHLDHQMGLAELHASDQPGQDEVQDGYDIDGQHGSTIKAFKGPLKPIRMHETHSLHQARQVILHGEAQQHVSLSRLLNILDSTAKPALTAAADSLKAVQAYFLANSEWRAKRPIDDIISQLHSTKSALADARASLFSKDRLALLKPYLDHFQTLHPDLDIHQHFLQTNQSVQQFRSGARPLHVCLVFVTNLLDIIDILADLHDQMVRIADSRGNQKRVWWPKHLGKLYTVLSSKHAGTEGMDTLGGGDGHFDREDDIDQDVRQDQSRPNASSQSTSASNSTDAFDDDDSDGEDQNRSNSRVSDEEKPTSSLKASTKKTKREPRLYRRDPDALPPTKIVHRIGRALAGTYYFVSGPTGIFALRFCIATFAIWIITVLPHSAYFAYIHRGIWALIMAQTGLALHGGEMMFTFAARIIGTVVGLLIGAVGWYISTGLGNGNAYGLAAVVGVVFVPLVFVRIFAPKILLLPVIMTNVSFVLIAGYSWIDTHLAVLANSGVGIAVAWKRALLVIIGMTVAFFVMIFPRPVSSRMLVRKSLAKSTRHLNELYISITELWIAKNKQLEQKYQQQGFQTQSAATGYDATARNDVDDQVWKQREPAIRGQFMAVHAQIAALGAQIGLASLDFQIRGRWPVERYGELAGIQATILEALGSLAISVRSFDLPPSLSQSSGMPSHALNPNGDDSDVDWDSAISASTSLLDPQYISEICLTFDLLSKALRSGERLNHCHFSLLENFIRYSYRNLKIASRLRRSRQRTQNGHGPKDGKTSSATEDMEGDTVLSWSVLHDPMYMRYSTAQMAAISLVSQLDRFKVIVQDLVGQNALRGFDGLKDQHDDRARRALMSHSDDDDDLEDDSHRRNFK